MASNPTTPPNYAAFVSGLSLDQTLQPEEHILVFDKDTVVGDMLVDKVTSFTRGNMHFVTNSDAPCY